MSHIFSRAVLLAALFVIALMNPAHAQSNGQLPDYELQRPAPQKPAPTGQIPSDSRFVLSDDFKTCSADTDCTPFPTTCDSGTPRCCEFEAVNRLRLNDVMAIKDRTCSSSAIRPIACTVCDTDISTSQKTICRKNQCVYGIISKAPQSNK